MSEVNLYPGDGMGGEVKSEEKKWEEEFERIQNRVSSNYDFVSSKEYSMLKDIQTLLQACKVMQGDEITLELAFKDGKFSGIVVGDRLIEDGEVVEYVKKRQEEIGEIEKRWPKLFPLERTLGELVDFVVEANRDIQTLLSLLSSLEKAEKHRVDLGKMIK